MNTVMEATEEDKLLANLANLTSGVNGAEYEDDDFESVDSIDNEGNEIESAPMDDWHRKLQCVFGAVLLVAFAFFTGMYISHIGKRGSRNNVIPGGWETDTSNKVTYEATQFISFTINTLGGLDAHGECEGRFVDPKGVCYLGNQNNISEDVTHRLQIFKEILGRIESDRFAESPDIDHSSKVLKILMLPEFFLRGPFGAYSIDELLDGGILLEVADQVRDIISDDIFEHYLFVLGTVVAANPAPDDPQDRPTSDIEYYNFSPVYKGGSGHEHHYVVTKHYISGADFLDRTSLPNPKKANVNRYAHISKQLQALFEKRGTTLVENNLIIMDGLRIGIEICLDHRLGVLWDNIKTKKADVGLVDVHLIISAGMAIDRGPNPVIPGGVVYLTDGEASSAACRRMDGGAFFDPDKVCRGDIAGLKHIPHGGPGYSDYFPITACIDIEKSSLLDGYYSLYQTQGCAYTLKLYGIDVMDEFQFYPPSIEIYPTVALP